jgi:hypothetical protein
MTDLRALARWRNEHLVEWFLETVTARQKGLSAGTLTNEKVFVSLEPNEFDREAFGNLADWLKSTIQASPEYRRISSNGGGYDASDGRVGADDSIPF